MADVKQIEATAGGHDLATSLTEAGAIGCDFIESQDLAAHIFFLSSPVKQI
jgi:hypothetical protein